jgi:hypothetical protein
MLAAPRMPASGPSRASAASAPGSARAAVRAPGLSAARNIGIAGRWSVAIRGACPVRLGRQLEIGCDSFRRGQSHDGCHADEAAMPVPSGHAVPPVLIRKRWRCPAFRAQDHWICLPDQAFSVSPDAGRSFGMRGLARNPSRRLSRWRRASAALRAQAAVRDRCPASALVSCARIGFGSAPTVRRLSVGTVHDQWTRHLTRHLDHPCATGRRTTRWQDIAACLSASRGR